MKVNMRYAPILIIANFVVLAIVIFLMTLGNAGTIVGLVILILQVIYTWKSIRSVDTSRQAGLLTFGAYTGDLSPGFACAPFGFCKIIHVTKRVIEQDLPDSPENIYHGDPNEGSAGGVIPAGKTPALRFNFPEKVTKKDIRLKVKVFGNNGVPPREIEVTIPKDDSLLRRQTVEVEISYGFRVLDGKLRDFYEKIGNVDDAVVNMNDHAIAGFNSRLTILSLAEAMFLLEEIARDVKEELSDYSKDWGIEVTFARIKPFGISHKLNVAIRDRAMAIERKKEKITASEGEETSLTNIGKGKGNAEQSILVGRATGQKALVEASNLDGGRTQAIQAIGDAMAKAQLIVAPNNNLLGAVAGIGAVLKNLPDPTPDETKGGGSK